MQECKKILGSGHNNNTTTLIISNNDMEDLIKVVKSLEDSGLILEGVTEPVQSEVKEQKGGFLSMLLVTLGTSLLGNLLTGRGINKKRKGLIRAGERIVRASYDRPSSSASHNKKSQKNNKMNF